MSSRNHSLLSRVPRLRLWFLLALPALISVLVDVWLRPSRFAEFSWVQRLGYLGAWLECTVVWGMLLLATVQRRRWLSWTLGGLFVVGYTFSLGGQVYFYQQYRAYLNRDLSLFAVNLMDSVVNQLWADASGYLLAKLPFIALSAGMVLLVQRWGVQDGRRHQRWPGLSAPVLLLAACFVPAQHRRLQAATPDALYLNALGGFFATQLGLTEQASQVRPRPRASLPVGALAAHAHPRRNVVLVVSESLRADAACSRYAADCQLTPYTNRLFPERIPLLQLRAMDSTTAISLAVLWSGLSPTEDVATMHTWPLIFDYARAAGWDTAFWTSQNLMFGNTRLWVKNLGTRLFVSGTELDPTCDIDMGADEAALAVHIEQQWGALREPFLAVIQLSNTHYPYRVEAHRPQPFQPAEFDKGDDGRELFRNYYQNSVVQSDQHLARALSALRNSEAGQRTVVVYTADHGEAFRDHYQMGHTFSLFDEEIKVPGFVDAPPGTLTGKERSALESRTNALTFHVDITPTILDLVGVWESPKLARFRRRFPGQSWLRGISPLPALPMTNCAAVWSCAFENWGAMQGRFKIFARTPYDTGWQCHDVLADPNEQVRLDVPECRRLQGLAEAWFGKLPN